MELKLNFLKRILTDTVNDENIMNTFLNKYEFPSESKMIEIIKSDVFENRLEGLDWPERAHTMIGIKRLNNLHDSLDYVRKNKIKGDFIETGVWRGGASIFMKYYNDIYDMNRKVFVCDSFEGLPVPDLAKYPNDAGDMHHTFDFLKVSLDEVKQNFKMYNVLDDNVIFLKGWFNETLKNNNEIKELSILRFDGDMYGSTIDVLSNLYHKLTKNGVIIIDDYCLQNCVKAVTDFRINNNINDEIKVIDKCGVFWYKNK
jgi:O-methyltransferase